MSKITRVRTDTLDVAYEESGAADGAPVLLMHGWPYDPRCYDAVIAPLTAEGARVIGKRDSEAQEFRLARPRGLQAGPDDHQEWDDDLIGQEYNQKGKCNFAPAEMEALQLDPRRGSGQ